MPDTADLIEGFKALDEARNGYVWASTYYEGTIPERFVTEKIRQLVEKSADGTYRFRFAKIPVNAMRNRVSIAQVTGATDAISAKLDEIRQANDMELWESFIHERYFVYGDAYVLTQPAGPDEPDVSGDEDVAASGVEIRYQSPLSCRAMYDSADGKSVRYVIRRWKVADPLSPHGRWHAETWYPDGTIEPWVCTPGNGGTDPTQWLPDTSSGEWPIVHDFGLPIRHARSALPYGRPEHIDAIGPQDAIQKALLTQVVEIESHGWIDRWEILDPAANADSGQDAVSWEGPAGEAPAKLNATSKRKSGPGTVQILEGRKSTGEYSRPMPGDLNAPLDMWVRMLSTVTETPAYEYDPRSSEQMSGIARQWADRPIAAREGRHKMMLVRFWREVYGDALDMVGVSTPGLITIGWARPQPINDPDWWEVATIRREHGVPQDVILTEANYSPEQIKAWLDEHGEALTLDRKIMQLQKLGEAMQAIGAATALVPDLEAQVAPLVARIMGEATSEPVDE